MLKKTSYKEYVEAAEQKNNVFWRYALIVVEQVFKPIHNEI
jgi:hypothetical protein